MAVGTTTYSGARSSRSRDAATVTVSPSGQPASAQLAGSSTRTRVPIGTPVSSTTHGTMVAGVCGSTATPARQSPSNVSATTAAGALKIRAAPLAAASSSRTKFGDACISTVASASAARRSASCSARRRAW